MFGGSSESSSATSQSNSAINSSGWSVGKSSAGGGDLSTSNGFALPTGAIISAGVVILAWLYFKNKKGR